MKAVRNTRRGRKKLRSRSGRLALMVSDVLLLGPGPAQALELLKYLHGVRNERLVHFKSAGAAREGGRVRGRGRRTGPPFPASSPQPA